jgi:hypothetical protein
MIHFHFGKFGKCRQWIVIVFYDTVGQSAILVVDLNNTAYDKLAGTKLRNLDTRTVQKNCLLTIGKSSVGCGFDLLGSPVPSPTAADL